MTRSFVTIDSLKIFARHGVLPEEQINGNTFEISVKVEYDISEAARTDDVAFALDYAELTAIVVEQMQMPRRLLETVVVDLRRQICRRWPQIKSGTISLTKLNPPIPSPTPRATIVLEWSE